MAATARPHRFRDMTGATSEDYEAVKQDMRRWLDSPEGIAACEGAIETLGQGRQAILERTGGRGIAWEEIQAALDRDDDG